MTDTHSAQERTEQATAKRLSDAREKGQIPRSRELTTMLVLLASATALWLSAEQILGGLTRIMRGSFTLDRVDVLNDAAIFEALVAGTLTGLASLAPFFLVVAGAAALGPIAIGGWSCSGDAVAFKWERIDPIAGIGRLCSLRSVIEVAKAIAKFLVLLGFGLAALHLEFDAIRDLAKASLEQSLARGFALSFHAFVLISAGTALIALIDVPFQLWQHGRELRMTRQELKDETKESEGAPEVKGRIRRLQQELASRRMMEEVPKADVVITNPEHYAVALRFDPLTMAAPRVVAKGADRVALRIREQALRHGVTLLAAPPLARAIYHSTKLNHEIPAGLYVAVAQVLAYVYQLKRRTAGSPAPLLPAELPIPSELQY